MIGIIVCLKVDEKEEKNLVRVFRSLFSSNRELLD